MKQKRITHLLEMIDHHADTFARIPLTNLEDAGEIAVRLISSVLDYRVVVLLVENGINTPELLASKGIDNDDRSAWTTREAFVRHLCSVINRPSILECNSLDEASASFAHRLGLGEMFLAVPLRGYTQNGGGRVGLVVAAQPHRDYDPNVDIMAIEIIAGVLSGTISKCIAATKLLEIYEAMNTEIDRLQRTEEALRESEKRFSTFVDHFPGAAFMKDEESNHIYVNRYMRDRSWEKEWIGKSSYEIFPKELAHQQRSDDERTLREGIQEITETVPDKNGVNRTYRTVKFPILMEGKPPISGGIAIDITKQVEAEKALLEREKRFRRIVEDTEAGYFFVDQNGRFMDVNKAWLRMHGFSSRDEVIGQHFSFTQVDEDLEAAQRNVERLLSGKTIPTGEFSRRCKDGSVGYHTFSASPVVSGGKIVGLEGFLIDVTEHKRAEEVLQQSKGEWEKTFNSISDWVCLIDLNSRILRTNVAGEKFVKLPADDMFGQTCCRLVHGSDKPIAGCPVQRMIETRQRETLEFQTPDGLWLMVSADPVTNKEGQLVGAVHISRDVTKRKQAEEALSESIHRVKVAHDQAIIYAEKLKEEIAERKKTEKALRENEAQKQAILDASVDMIMQVDTEMRIVWANRKAAAVVNKTREDLAGHTCHKVFQNADSPCPGCPCKKALETGNIEHGIMYQPAMDVVGESYWEDYGVPLKDESGKVVAVIEIARNVTEKVKAEQALVRAKEDWENTFDATTDMIMLLDNEHQILRVNKAAAEALNTTKESFIGKKCYDAIHGRSLPIRRCPLILTMKTLEPHSTEITEPNLGGTFICSTSPMVNSEGKLTGYTHSLKDITESKHLEAQLEQARKLEAIGTLAGGVAHDFNNLLMGIQGNISLMQLDMDPMHPHYRRLIKIEQQVQSGAMLTSQLLGYARKGRYEVKLLNLNHLVKDVSETFGRTKKEITIYRELAEDLFAIHADQGQIERVLLNLFVNAADAMPNGGDLILKTDNVTHNDMKGKVYEPKPGNYVLLTVTDTGMGMDKEIMDRIFDPFFTTKEMSTRGAGLGLASTYGIIKGHGGYIDVESKKDHGTTFGIYLPASERGLPKPAGIAEPFVSGTETILLVDDEEVILEIGQELLEAMGYRVLLARDGREAIEVYRKNQDGIDLVLLDMVMPNMGGGETYDRMKEIKPDIKVLLSSGYSIDGEAEEILERGCDGFIQKPFRMNELSEKIRGILDKK